MTLGLHEILLLIAMGLCALPLVMTIINLRLYQAPARDPADEPGPLVSVCVPARNEASNLEACVGGLLAQTHSNLEILVYDDASTDATPSILAQLVARDARVRAATTTPLPEGWNGKQHACFRMGEQARGEWLAFTDADVRFAPECVASSLAAARQLDAQLVSTFPRQITGTLAERLVVPMIFFILFSYLPFPRMRKGTDPSTSAGCGQYLFVRRDAYFAAGTHAAFKDSMHDGIKLPRALRKAGFRSDLFDGTHLCHVRMYQGLASTWRGFAKNAYEGLGSVGLLLFLTVAHALGHVWPWALGVWMLLHALELAPAVPGLSDSSPAPIFAACAISMAFAQRLLLAWRFRQGLVPPLFHPFGVLAMTAIQWHSLALHITGRRTWRGRRA